MEKFTRQESIYSQKKMLEKTKQSIEYITERFICISFLCVWRSTHDVTFIVVWNGFDFKSKTKLFANARWKCMDPSFLSQQWVNCRLGSQALVKKPVLEKEKHLTCGVLLDNLWEHCYRIILLSAHPKMWQVFFNSTPRKTNYLSLFAKLWLF